MKSLINVNQIENNQRIVQFPNMCNLLLTAWRAVEILPKAYFQKHRPHRNGTFYLSKEGFKLLSR